MKKKVKMEQLWIVSLWKEALRDTIKAKQTWMYKFESLKLCTVWLNIVIKWYMYNTFLCSVSALTWFSCVVCSWWEVYQTSWPQQRSGHLPEYTHHDAVFNFLSERVQVWVLTPLRVCMQGRDLEPPAFLPQVYSR